jgi:3-methylfumaryl-CoA hydratase
VNLQDWIGRSETCAETIARARVVQIAACLDRDAPGDELPPGWHWGFFNPTAKQSALGPDGHPKRGGFLPPVALERRMWAGGTLVYHAPLPVGAVATRVSTIRRIDEKQGRSGALVFVVVDHAIRCGDTLCLEETHDIVYRAVVPAAAPTQAQGDADWKERRAADAVLLFRYSAVTFNGHRIHYDRAYAQNVEAYPGLVVHGPLLATLLQDFAERSTGRRLQRFSFRSAAPLFDGEPFELCGKRDGDFWIAAGDGRLIQRAHAEFAPSD